MSDNEKHTKPKRSILRKIAIIFLTVLIILFSFLFTFLALLSLPATQNYLKDKAIKLVNQKIGVSIKLDSLQFGLDGNIKLTHLYIPDYNHDTLISMEKLRIQINTSLLLKNEVHILNLSLHNTIFNFKKIDSTNTNLSLLLKGFGNNDSIKKDTKSEPSKWKIKLDHFHSDGLQFVFQNLYDSMYMRHRLEKIDLKFREGDIIAQRFIARNIAIENYEGRLISYKKNQATNTENKDTASSTTKIVLAAPQIEIKNSTFSHFDSSSSMFGKYTIEKGKIMPKSIDLVNQNIIIDTLFLEHAKVTLKGSTKVKNKPVNNNTGISETQNNETKNWKITLLQSDIEADSISILNLIPGPKGFDYLSNLKLKDAKLILEANFKSGNDWQANKMQAAFTDMRTNQKMDIQVKAKIINNYFFLDYFNFTTRSTSVEGNAKINLGNKSNNLILPNFLIELKINPNDLISYLPNTYYPAILKNQTGLTLTSNLHSENQVFTGNLIANSLAGNMEFQTTFKNNFIPGKSSYNAHLQIQQMDVAHILKDSSIGIFSGSVNASGIIAQNDTFSIKANAYIDSILYKNVGYHNIDLEAAVENNNLNITVNSPNNIANFNINLYGNYKKKERELHMMTDIRNVNFRAMNLMKDTLSLSGVMNVHYKLKNNNAFEIYSDTSNLRLKTKQNEINTQQQWSYYSSEDSVAAEFYSDNINFLYKGNIRLEDIATNMSNYFMQYYATDKEKQAKDERKKFIFSLSVNDLNKFSDIMPAGMSIPGQNQISAKLEDKVFESDININKIALKDFSFDTISLKLNSDTSSINLDLSMAINNPKYDQRRLALNSKLSEGNLVSRIKISDPQELAWFDLGFEALLKFPLLRAKIVEPLIVNHQYWTIDSSNILEVYNKQIQKLNIRLENEPKLFHVYLHPKIPNTYAAEIKELNLAFFSDLIWGDTVTLNGDLYGNLLFSPAKEEKSIPMFDIEMNVDQLKMKEYALGNMRLKISNRKNSNIADINFRQALNDVNLIARGTFGLANDNPINMMLMSRNLDISKFEPLMAAFVDEPKGLLNANLNITGNLKNPNIEGNLNFKDISLGIRAIQTRLNINDQAINFKPNKQISLNSFTIKDGRGNPLIIDGTINYADIKNISYQTRISSKKFQVYSTPDDVMAGKESRIFLTSDIRLNGTGKQPFVRANLQIDEGSRFFHELSNQYNNYSEAGVVVFADTQIVMPNAPVSIVKNLSLTANLTIANGTVIHIITDPARGDGFNLQAGGALSISQQPFQNPRLTGKVDISKGQYIMNLTGFKRSFDIGPGSSINWNGDIMNIDFKLHAYYTVKASPIPILPNANASQYSGLLPFMVNLNLEGSLSEPDMEFDISLPDEYRDVYNGMVASRLQQINSDEAMVNKQAMSLLLFGTFFDLTDISNSLLSGRSSTNVLISNALNQFAAQEIKFINLHFDLQTYDYYGSGENFQDARSELKIDASKRFWNGKMNTQAGADILLQGDPREEAQLGNDRVTPSFKIDYFVNKKRTVSLKLFQQNEYRGLLEGKVISIGTGIQYSNDYNSIRDLIKKKNAEVDNTYVQ